MMRDEDRRFYGKIIFKGSLKAETGLKIGAGRNVAEIGGVDSPVMRDPLTHYSYIPGSSLKGRLRSLFEIYVNSNKQKYNISIENFFNKDIGTRGNPIHIHVCPDYDTAIDCPVCRLFGASGDKSNFPSRIIVRDLYLTKDWKNKPLDELTEVKPEVSIDRVTSKTNLRQFERVVAGTEFEFEVIYNVERLDQWEDDVRNLLTAMALLEDSYLGGSGSRGYGKVKFEIDTVELRTPEYYRTGEDDKKVVLQGAEGKPISEILRNFGDVFSGVKGKLGVE